MPLPPPHRPHNQADPQRHASETCRILPDKRTDQPQRNQRTVDENRILPLYFGERLPPVIVTHAAIVLHNRLHAQHSRTIQLLRFNAATVLKRLSNIGRNFNPSIAASLNFQTIDHNFKQFSVLSLNFQTTCGASVNKCG
jgi:hypothetical protein